MKRIKTRIGVGKLTQISSEVKTPYKNMAKYTMISKSESCDTSKS